jgi:translation initiation factor 5B
MEIRSPILVALGHVDHGKTTLLDKIRGTAIAKTEPGLITQYISASYIPNNVIRSVSGRLLDKINIDLTIPGLLWVDSPGHEAFTTLRKRGGAIADIAVLVVDANEGFQPQTLESLNFLKQFKTPFVVALTKIDRLLGWNPHPGESFLISWENQSDRAQEQLEEKFYRVLGQLGAEGFQGERYDRISDYTKQIAIVPVSGLTGEGVPDLLMVLSGIAQRYLKKGLEITPGEGKGTILEVKEYKGLGVTVDAVIYDGEVRKGDYLVIGGKEIVKTKIKALLKPQALKELRIEKDFSTVESVTAAAGIKISAPGLDGVVPGSPIRSVRSEDGVEKAMEEVREEVEEVEIEADREGLILKADTLGSLEALIKTLKELKIPISRAHVGNVTKSDVMEAKSLKKPIIFAFGLKVPGEIETMAKDHDVYLFSSNIIYSLIEDYQKWEMDKKKRGEEALLKAVTRPARVMVLKGFVFRQRKPAVFGVEVVKGTLKSGSILTKKGNEIGEVKEIQEKGETKDTAESGNKVALSLPDAIVGKDFQEGDTLDVLISEREREKLEKIRKRLTQGEIELLDEE